MESPAPFDIAEFLKHLTTLPGVYRMLDGAGEVIYVGKARNLKNRVSSYFRKGADLTPKTRALVAQVARIEVTITYNDVEALLLENNLIKALKPRYNILLRDDKSYPYIFLSKERFPRLAFHRGKQTARGSYFGPYPSASAVRESLSLLQKLFPVRQCEDAFFRNRTRPCLQYQIKRCSGPCVDLVTPEQYAEEVRHAALFLEGKNDQVIEELARKMEGAAQALAFERAAHYRDQIANLRRIQERQYITGDGGHLDVVAGALEGGAACIQVFFIRGGRNLGNKAFFPRNIGDSELREVLGAFLAQFYLEGAQSAGDEKVIPGEILVNVAPEEPEVLEQVLSQQAGRRVTLTAKVRGDRARWVGLAETNARHALTAHLASRAHLTARFEALQEALGLESLPQRIECFDISHTMGEAPVASCVVFDPGGPVKSDYRRYNIEGITGGDDYAAMAQALTRRFRKVVEGEGSSPDLLLIDGGKGQVAAAELVLEEMQLRGMMLLGVAKGPTRKAGLEQLILSGGGGTIILPEDSAALHLIQQVRDEAHRFAITGHRQRRAKSRRASRLEEIPGLGPKRRQALLRQFGGLQEVARAGVEDLAAVRGISRELAQRIYDIFHPD